MPYTGIMPIETTIDHTGPMTATVEDNALLLESIAGEDGMDPRQYSVETASYTEALGQGVSGLKIGVVTEGFGHANSEEDVDASVRKGAKLFEELQAQVEQVSIPMHLAGQAIWTPLAIEGLHWQMMLGNGYGMNWKGLYLTSLMDRHAQWRERADELSPMLKLCMFLGEWFIKHYNGSSNITMVVRQVPESDAETARDLHQGTAGLRPALDADLAAKGDQAARARRGDRRDHRPRA